MDKYIHFFVLQKHSILDYNYDKLNNYAQCIVDSLINNKKASKLL